MNATTIYFDPPSRARRLRTNLKARSFQSLQDGKQFVYGVVGGRCRGLALAGCLGVGICIKVEGARNPRRTCTPLLLKGYSTCFRS